MKPGIMMYPYALVIWIRGKYLLKLIMPLRHIKRQLIVPWCCITPIGVHPDLQNLDQAVVIFIEFAVHDTCSGTHHLNITISDNGSISHTILVFQISFQRNADDLHIVVRMCAETAARFYSIIIKDTQYTEIHPH